MRRLYHIYAHNVCTVTLYNYIMSMYTSALDIRGMSCVTAVSHIFHTCVVHSEAVSVIITAQVCSALFTHHCCLADLVWVVSVTHSSMCVLVALVTCRTDDTGVVFADSSHWPVVSAIQTGCGVGDSTTGSPSCLRSFLVVIPDKLMGKVEFEGQKVPLGLAIDFV